MSHVMRKPAFANKDVDQPAHPRSLISIFVIRCLDSIIPLVSIYEILSLQLVSVAEQTGLSLPWSETPKTGFLVARLKYIMRSIHVPLIISTNSIEDLKHSTFGMCHGCGLAMQLSLDLKSGFGQVQRVGHCKIQ